MKINMPKDVDYIIYKLIENGYEAYIVGGCVRDCILGLEPKDWDITTSALPEQIIEVFKGYKIIPTGLKHGTVTIVIDNENYEITTYRVDGEYEDNRHPKNVTFTTSLKEDLSRRDLTINAMAYNSKDGLVDYFNGFNDLITNKLIKTVGNPDDRFKEDALRILRAIRFSAKFNFEIEINTKVAMKYHNKKLQYISRERIRDEFNKILIYNPEYILKMNELIISPFISDIFLLMEGYNQNNPYHNMTLLNHCINATKIVNTLELKLTMIFHDIGKLYCQTTDDKEVCHYKGHAKISSDLTKNIMKNLRYSNEAINTVTTLINLHDYSFSDYDKTIKKQLKRLLNKYNEEIIKKLFIVRIADISSQEPKYLLNRLNKIYKVENIFNNILKECECFSLKNLNINGYDLINLGYTGKEIGEKLNMLLEAVINEEVKNNKDELIKFITK